jgi:thymidylate synthase ThyX
VPEEYTPEERARLSPYFSNLDSHVFALTNLPETVKGALFARYSRSAKPLRRLFLDEFADKVATDLEAPTPAGGAGLARAEKLYARVFSEYGDDSVAQLGGAHIACEYVSNLLTKVLEWGRLMAYLEQSTRYVPIPTSCRDGGGTTFPKRSAPDRCASGTCA